MLPNMPKYCLSFSDDVCQLSPPTKSLPAAADSAPGELLPSFPFPVPLTAAGSVAFIWTTPFWLTGWCATWFRLLTLGPLLSIFTWGGALNKTRRKRFRFKVKGVGRYPLTSNDMWSNPNMRLLSSIMSTNKASIINNVLPEIPNLFAISLRIVCHYPRWHLSDNC